MADRRAIQGTIDSAIYLASKIERVKSDVEYRYMIIGDDALFAFRSQNFPLRQRVENIIMDQLYREAGYHFQLVYPDPTKENRRAFNDSRYIAKLTDSGIDPRHTIDKWNMFGKPVYIDAKIPIHPSDISAIDHIEKMVAAGYNESATFEEFCGIYLEVYGCMPVDGYLKEKAKMDGAL